MDSGRPRDRRRMTIGTLSGLTGVNIETIRHYEQIGILPKPERSAGNQRLYARESVKRLRFVRRCRELGFPLDDIRALLRLADGGEDSCAGVKAITLAHAADIHRRIVDLRKMERVLRDMVARCDGDDPPDCPILDALSA